ncbi:MAG: glycosyltransferase [Spirochaetales bacterium]|nr:glycosyltransferase [Spirochaetales bacterium]
MLNNTTEYQYREIILEKYSRYADISSIKSEAESLKSVRILNINSVSHGGGVAAILSKIVPLKNKLSILTHWYVPESATDDFFVVTKKQHNMFQGQTEAVLSEAEKNLYWKTQKLCAEEIKKDIGTYDIVVVHDTQFLGLINYLKRYGQKWIYRCHIDTTNPNPDIVKFFKPVIVKYDASVYHLKSYILEGSPNPFIMPPSTDPFEPKNDLSAVTQKFIQDVISSFGLDYKKPILLQVGRFDPAKGYEDVCMVFKEVKKSMPDVQLLLTGAGAKDDPEFKPYLKRVKSLISGYNDAVVQAMPFDVLKLNAVQQAGTIIYALSNREGFGLVVSEASIKAKPVIVRNVGGLPEQVVNGKTGYVVQSVDEAVKRTLELLKNKDKRISMGKTGREYILSKFITPIHVKNYITLFKRVLGQL